MSRRRSSCLLLLSPKSTQSLLSCMTASTQTSRASCRCLCPRIPAGARAIGKMMASSQCGQSRWYPPMLAAACWTASYPLAPPARCKHSRHCKMQSKTACAAAWIADEANAKAARPRPKTLAACGAAPVRSKLTRQTRGLAESARAAVGCVPACPPSPFPATSAAWAAGLLRMGRGQAEPKESALTVTGARQSATAHLDLGRTWPAVIRIPARTKKGSPPAGAAAWGCCSASAAGAGRPTAAASSKAAAVAAETEGRWQKGGLLGRTGVMMTRTATSR
mmetsp:Transcript_9441/g.24060  ORF Transcript_9441/g.24060 Transcript_9441/m.24060 type:complete len:278 (+) Transcript_9441:2379-3212(+)